MFSIHYEIKNIIVKTTNTALHFLIKHYRLLGTRMIKCTVEQSLLGY